MTCGYHGAYLRIDVSRGTVERVPLDEALLRQYIGGSGLGVRLLLDEGAAGIDPLAPDAPLVFAFSPLVGSPLTTSAKFAVVSKSPLTGRINDSLASSGFAVAGKRCGGDAIVIVGRAPELSVLIVDEEADGDGVMRARGRLEPAAEYRGATCRATEAGLKARLGADYRVASIGQQASTRFAMPRFRTMGAMPAAAEAAPFWVPRISRRSRYAGRNAWSGRIRRS